MAGEQAALSTMAALGAHPRVANAVFRFTRWGNPFAPERFSWPYPMYDRMRAGGEVAYGKPYRQWFVFGYDEVQEVLASPHTTTSAVAELLLATHRYRKLTPAARASFARWLLTIDPPDHTRLRSAVSRAFTPRQVAAYEPLVEKTVAELLDDLPGRGEIDMFEAFTNRLPIRVISELLGLPADERDWLLVASREIGLMFEPLTVFDPVSMSRRFAELDSRFRAIIGARRREPADDLISALAAREEGASLDDDEVLAMIGFLLFAGHETVTGMLGNALVALARWPEQRSLLRGRPDLVGNAVEELLRYDPSVQVSGRRATADISAGGVTIPNGATIGLMIGAANHDARKWPDPGLLRLDRDDPKPISFGFGPHYCLGAALARMELRAALPPLLDRLGDYSVAADRVQWKHSFALRGPIALPINPRPH
jgi:cytochrome P450